MMMITHHKGHEVVLPIPDRQAHEDARKRPYQITTQHDDETVWVGSADTPYAAMVLQRKYPGSEVLYKGRSVRLAMVRDRRGRWNMEMMK